MYFIMIREKIKTVLEKNKITKYRVYKETAINHSFFNRFLKGNANLSIDNLEKVLKFLNLELVEKKNKKISD